MPLERIVVKVEQANWQNQGICALLLTRMVPALASKPENSALPRTRQALTDQQRQTIANAFEEGHYVMGVTILDGLCDANEYLPDQYVLYLDLSLCR